MNYEKAIQEKHAFEDSLKEVLRLLSIMDRRELELAAAKLADGLNSEDELIDQKSAVLTAKIIQLILDLKARGELSKGKILRIWMRRRKKTYAYKLASISLAPDVEKYKREIKKVERIREVEKKDHIDRVNQWHRQVNSLSLWNQIFNKPQHPSVPQYTPFPRRPMDPIALGNNIAKTKSFGELLIEMVYYHKYQNTEYSDNYVNKENVRSTAMQVLEVKR